ncbi:ABC transporter ATP-binding protein [Rhizobium puerariae]|uniref:ABC transporter ATP-binding protein n=1 Tax=Rhizobium puerariae TaxID=1585791 RepID=A0ABV6AMF4_9HYPH
MTELIIENMSRDFGSFHATRDINFHIADGEFVTLLGPSGCGKSTTLAAVAGLDRPTEGTIRTTEKVFFSSAQKVFLPAEDRNCGLVFQSYALWPHLTVFDNVAFPLKLRRVPKVERNRMIEQVLALVEMEPFAGRYPHELSGGQQQRVALARTLVYKPSILLLDEPLSNLDAKLRERARVWLGELKRQLKMTTLYVTHDQAEALTLSDRIVIMDKGRIVQIATPEEIYENPAEAFVADFIGTSSFFPATVVGLTGSNATVRFSDGSELKVAVRKDIAQGSKVRISVRPERMQVLSSRSEAPEEDGTVLSARIRSRSYLGARFQYELEAGDAIAKVETHRRLEDADALLWVPSSGSIAFRDKVVAA